MKGVQCNALAYCITQVIFIWQCVYPLLTIKYNIHCHTYIFYLLSDIFRVGFNSLKSTCVILNLYN